MQESTLVLLLSRSLSKNIIDRYNYLSNNKILTKIILGNKKVPDNYYGLNHIGHKNKRGRYGTTAWECAFYELFKYEKLPEFIYFIEDDVFAKTNHTFLDFILSYNNNMSDLLATNIYSKEDSPKWHWWENDKEHSIFSKPYRSFNPLCRLSSKLISNIKLHHSIYNRFFYHEFLFASLAKQNNLTVYNYDEDKRLIGSIAYRPILNQKDINDNKIYHPVKNLK